MISSLQPIRAICHFHEVYDAVISYDFHVFFAGKMTPQPLQKWCQMQEALGLKQHSAVVGAAVGHRTGAADVAPEAGLIQNHCFGDPQKDTPP